MDSGAGAMDFGGEGAGVMDTGDWRTQLLPGSRQRIVNKIMETLKRHIPVYGHEGSQEPRKIAVRFEEKIYKAATSQNDYLRKISLKMLTITNSVHPNAASRGQNALGPGILISSQIQMNSGAGAMDSGGEGAGAMDFSGGGAGVVVGAMDTGDWRTQLLPDSRQRIVNRIMETLKRHIPVDGLEGSQELKKIAVRFEEKIYAAATSQNDYLWKASSKMLTMEGKSQNPITNSLHPNAAPRGQNALGAEMTMEATSYQTTSGPEESDEEQAAEEDDGGMSKEDVVEEVVVTKEQNYVVGHKENVKVGETEISCGLDSGAKLDERLAQVEGRLEKMEAHSKKVETLLVDINKKLNYLVKTQDAKVSRDIRRPAKYVSSSWTGNGRSKRKNRVAEMIRQSCKHRRLGRGDKAVIHPVALHDGCVENDQRKLDETIW